MWLKSVTLGAVVLSVARAAPQEVIPVFPIKNSTSSTSTPTQSSCVAQCSVYYPQLSAVSWVPENQIVYTTKITVGTISYVVVTSNKAILGTRTQTVYNAVPTEYDLYRQITDDSGTVALYVPVTSSDNVVFSQIAYPSNYVDYFTDYHWEGVLPTNDKAYSPICETATPTPFNAALYKHPEYPQPKVATAKVDENDPFGYEHKPIWVSIEDEPDKSWFDLAFPSESAFSSCSSVQRPAPAPTQFSAPKYILDSTTVYTTSQTQGIIIIQSSETGWESQPPKSTQRFTPQIPHFESTQDGFGETTKDPPKPTSTKRNDNQLNPTSTAMIRYESTVSGFGPPGAVQTGTPKPPDDNNPPPNRPPSRPPGIPDIIVSIIHNNPEYFPRPPSNSAVPPNPAIPALSANPWAGPTPVFTYIPTVINGQTTTIPAYILPGTSATATIGERILIDGTPTVLAIPSVVLTMIPTTSNDVATSTPAYIISGSITATIGQTVVIDGTTTVLSAPTETEGPGGGRAVVTSNTQPQSTTGTGNDQFGAGRQGSTVAWSAALFGLGGLMIVWL